MMFTRKLLTAVAILMVVTPQMRSRAQGGDPSGFVPLLNAARAQRGLAPVAFDPNLAAHAGHNNALQAAHGLGHHAMAQAGQCAAAAFDGTMALGMWAASPAHASILFSPGATTCGFAVGGGWATANVSSGGYTATYSAGVTTWGYATPQACQPMPRRRGLFRRW